MPRDESLHRSERYVGDMLGQAPGVMGAAGQKAARYVARAEAARAAREAGYRSPLRRLIAFLIPRHRG